MDDETKRLKEMVRSLWGRVRMLEMIVVRQSSCEATGHMLFKIRGSLHETGDAYRDEPVDSFDDVFCSLEIPLDTPTATD